MRLHSGLSTSSLPEAPAAREALAAMLQKWLPRRIPKGSLEVELQELQERTRETFERLFS
jgi:hypothetical protein